MSRGAQTVMYPKTQYPVFANAIILTELGFEQSNPLKPWLFRYRIHKRVIWLYADLGGSDVVPIYEDTAAMLYVSGIPDEPHDVDCDCASCTSGLDLASDIEYYLTQEVAVILQREGVAVRTGFESPVSVDRIDINPVRYVDRRMLSGLVKSMKQASIHREAKSEPAREAPPEPARSPETERRYADLEVITLGADDFPIYGG